MTTRTEKTLSEYAVHPREDLKDALLRYYVDKDDSSKKQQETVPSVVEEWDTYLSKYILFSIGVSLFSYKLS